MLVLLPLASYLYVVMTLLCVVAASLCGDSES